MTLRISKWVTVDGENIHVSIECGSVKEGLVWLSQLADEAGAAPGPAAEPNATGASGGAKRTRRSSKEMDAAKARAATAGAAPGLPLPLPEPGAPGPQAASAFGPPTGAPADTGSSANGGFGPPVGFAPGPPADLDTRSVGFAPPPGDPAIELRNEIRREFDAISGRVPANWRDTVGNSLNTFVGRHGPNLDLLPPPALEAVLAELRQYGQRCDAHLAGQRQ